MDIWWIVAGAFVAVLVCILLFRLHAFLTLLLAGFLVAGLTGTDALQDYGEKQVAKGEWTTQQADKLVDRSAISRLTTEFGTSAGKIGVLIALASVIGGCLAESGAATATVQRILKLVGPKRAPEAIAVSSFVIAIPVFFDTVFYLMLPLVRSMYRAIGKNYVLLILAVLAGGSIAHSLVPPTPGPLQVAETLQIDVGEMLIAGLVIGSISSCFSLAAAKLINRAFPVPMRDEENAGNGDGASEANAVDAAEMTDLADSLNPQNQPGLWESILPIIVPVLLISCGSLIKYQLKAEIVNSAWWTDLLLQLGDKNIAIAIGVLIAFPLTRYIAKEQRATLVSRNLASAGNIILITSAGGAFGVMLRQAGIASAVADLVHADAGLVLLPLAFVVTGAIRTLQGSATVAMMTSAGVLQGLVAPETLPFHPVYLAMAIGAGSKPISWMTDSAFWIITGMTGMTEAEGLKTISVMSIALGFSALFVTTVLAWLLPFAG